MTVCLSDLQVEICGVRSKEILTLMFYARDAKLGCANCNLLFYHPRITQCNYCILQVRGSMPFLWEQIVDLTYKPSFDVIRVEEAVSRLKLFFILYFVLSSGN
jgi:hypothetical protein